MPIDAYRSMHLASEKPFYFWPFPTAWWWLSKWARLSWMRRIPSLDVCDVKVEWESWECEEYWEVNERGVLLFDAKHTALYCAIGYISIDHHSSYKLKTKSHTVPYTIPWPSTNEHGSVSTYTAVMRPPYLCTCLWTGRRCPLEPHPPTSLCSQMDRCRWKTFSRLQSINIRHRDVFCWRKFESCATVLI